MITAGSPALFADISTPKGDMSVDSLDDAKSKTNEDSLSKIEMALKYVNCFENLVSNSFNVVLFF